MNSVTVGEASGSPPRISLANAQFWGNARLVKKYARPGLRPVEADILDRYGEDLSKRTLELGCGAGRLTSELSRLGGEVHGIDLSRAMIEYCQRTYPDVSFSQRDLRDLGGFGDGSFEAVLAPFNVLDVLDDAERRVALDELHRILGAGGLLVISSHNRGSAAGVARPRPRLSRDPRQTVASIVYFPARLRNSRRLRKLESSTVDFEVINDSAHNYSLLHYYISRDSQERQLEEHGFELLECLDLDGLRVERGELAPQSPELHYVARRLDGGRA
jgi:SAM-dependent methyltransferase